MQTYHVIWRVLQLVDYKSSVIICSERVILSLLMTLKSIMLLIVFPSPHLIKIALIFLWIILNHTWIVASVLIKMICTCKKSLYFILYAGLLRQPKWGHLKDLHRAIKLCEPALVSGNPTVMPLGNYQEVKLTCAFLSLFYFTIFQS